MTQTDLSGQAYEECLRDILALQQARPQLMIRARCAPYARRMLGLHAGEVAEERHGPPPGPRPAGGGDGGSPLRGSGALVGPAWGGPAPGYAEWSSACLAGRRYLRIGPKGEVTPCPYIPDSAGSVRWQSLREIWETGDAFVRLRREMPGGKCGACDSRVSCGGCRARALATAGDLMAEDGKCTYCPPPSATPEPLPARRSATLVWSPEAQQLLDRIPGFVRNKVRSSLEHQATVAGEASISLDFMLAHRPTSMPFGRPRASP